MKRRVETLKPYPFESDFRHATPEDPEQLRMSTNELAGLLAETREATAALVRDETLSAEAARLEQVSTQLRDCLSLIVNLAAHLETASIDEHDRKNALENVRKLAQTLVAGQGDLFAKTSECSSVGNHSDRSSTSGVRIDGKV